MTLYTLLIFSCVISRNYMRLFILRIMPVYQTVLRVNGSYSLKMLYILSNRLHSHWNAFSDYCFYISTHRKICFIIVVILPNYIYLNITYTLCIIAWHFPEQTVDTKLISFQRSVFISFRLICSENHCAAAWNLQEITLITTAMYGKCTTVTTPDHVQTSANSCRGF